MAENRNIRGGQPQTQPETKKDDTALVDASDEAAKVLEDLGVGAKTTPPLQRIALAMAEVAARTVVTAEAREIIRKAIEDASTNDDAKLLCDQLKRLRLVAEMADMIASETFAARVQQG